MIVTNSPNEPDADACYLALTARDARFDGRFFTGVLSTGIYCRPVCSVRTPKRQNCLFFHHAAQAESAGFRPCLRCRPELAPSSLPWSTQDASATLALQAARLMDVPSAHSISALATRLGVSRRHLQRIFQAHLGMSPLQYLQTRRLLTAKQLLADTRLPITQVALMSGFGSVRRFNAAFMAHYRLSPSSLRRQSAAPVRRGLLAATSITVRLGYRPPYDEQAMLAFFKTHVMAGSEFMELDAHGNARMGMTCRVLNNSDKAENITWHTGWLLTQFDTARAQLVLQVSDTLCAVLPQVIRRVRNLFDLDADPAAINHALDCNFPSAGGLRVPGALDGFELAVRAILGQQITVASARTLAQRLVTALGEPITTPWPALNRVFPTPATLANTSSDAMGAMGIIRQRQAAIVALAQAVESGQLQLDSHADVPSTLAALKALPGVGDWTAQYIAMRALRWPDAFPAGDVALHKALGVQGLKQPSRLAEAASAAWSPWRSYAVIRVWSGAWRGSLDTGSPELLLNPEPPS
ncbi:MAG: DNA-3-methyladenine glycosylase 2 family protein [Polaromonas sp.]|nr:DNA-3-methyladenine glycosylase 2 family protein [Polaromonas sp.]